MRIQVHAPAALEDLGIFVGGPRQLYWTISARCSVVSRLRVIITHCVTSALFMLEKLNCQLSAEIITILTRTPLRAVDGDAAMTVSQCSPQC